MCVLNGQREAFIRHMAACGVEASRVHLRNDLYPPFQDLDTAPLPNVTVFDTQQVNIPVRPVRAAEVACVIHAVNSFEEA